jgi:D-hexose-6-phosphate mutarotase
MNLVLPAGARLDHGRGGLPRLTIDTEQCRAELYLYGAHLCHWQPRSQPQPVLWMSQESWFKVGSPIRGGVPICFPWFGAKAGDPSAPGHGVARINLWTLQDVTRGADGTMTVRLSLASGEHARPLVPYEFGLAYELSLGAGLSMSLTVTNPGGAPITFEEALHTYFRVADVRQVRVTGLAGATYLDKVDGLKRKVQGDEPITVGAETDRLFVDTTTAVDLTDPGFGRRVSVAKSGSRSTVVWNPWVAKSKAMPDFGDEEWPGMICIETANAADNAVTLAAGATHTMAAAIRVENA